MIDLHIHTTYSDGKHSLIEVLKMAEEKNLEYISITDHDTVLAYNELSNIDIKKYYSGVIIPGVELTTIYNGVSVEVLGYGIDINKIKEEIEGHFYNKHDIQLIQFKFIKDVCTKLHLKFDLNLDLSKNGWAADTIYNELVNYEENIKFLHDLNIKSGSDFYRNNVCNKKSVFYFDERSLSIPFKLATKIIKDAGGIAFLAHPLGVYLFDNPKEVVEEIIKEGLVDGLECMHSSIAEEDSDYLIGLCDKYNLYKSGGSDFHDYLRPIGTSSFGKTTIPYELVSDWIKNIDYK